MPPQDGHGDEAAMLARAERAIETFRTRVISEDFTLDNDAAERVLRYFRRAAEGYPDDEDGWSAVIEFFGHHGGHVLGWILTGGGEGMICTPAALAVLERGNRKDADDDSRLLEIENEIFELKEEIEKFHPELARLQEIWTDEMVRLCRAPLAAKQRRAPCRRRGYAGVHRAQSISQTAEALHRSGPSVNRSDVVDTPACTAEGKRAKVLVLFGYIMCDDVWRENNADADWDIKQARDLMIELVGRQPSAQLRDQFAA